MRSFWAVLTAVVVMGCGRAESAAAQKYTNPCCIVKQQISKDSNLVFGRTRIDSVVIPRRNSTPRAYGRFVLDSLLGPVRFRWHDTTVYTFKDSTIFTYDTTFVFDTTFVLDTTFVFDTIPVYDTVVVYDTVIVTRPPTSPSGTARGKPFGPASLLEASVTAPFTFAANTSSNTPSTLVEKLAEARARGLKIQPTFPCGPHSATSLGYCLTVGADGIPRFDINKWNARIALYNTPEVRAAVATAWADGTLLGFHIMDEPWVTGQDDGSGVVVGNTWGPAGTMTKARVDGLCSTIKALFPDVPVGTSDNLTAWEPTKDYAVCDFGQFQYSTRFGPIITWRDAVIARAQRGGYQATFSFNPINGGTQDRDGTWDCQAQGGVKGQSSPNCSMTATEVTQAINSLGDLGYGGLMMWRYDPIRFNRADWQQAFTAGAAQQAERFVRPLKRRP